MKNTLKKSLGLLLALSMTISLLSVGFVARAEENANTVKSISLNLENAKIVYYFGETLDTSGVTATAHFNDGSTKLIPNEELYFMLYSYARYDPYMYGGGTRSIGVIYTDPVSGHQVSYSYDVDFRLYGIDTSNAKINYNLGEDIDVSGVKFTRLLPDGTTEILDNEVHLETYDYSYANYFDNTKVGYWDVLVSAKGIGYLSRTYRVYFNDPAVSNPYVSFEVDDSKVKHYYYFGQKFDSTGLVVTGIKEDGTKEILDYNSLKFEAPENFIYSETERNIDIYYLDYSIHCGNYKISVSEDGYSAWDLTNIRKYILGIGDFDETYLNKLDVNSDGQIDIDDLIQIRKILLGYTLI